MSSESSASDVLLVDRQGPVWRATLNRPAVRNAFDEVLIEELTRVFLSFSDDRETRVVVLSGEGPVL